MIIEVVLLSGRAAEVEADPGDSVALLRQRAQVALGVGRGRLAKPTGELLGPASLVSESGLQGGDHLTFHVGQVQVAAVNQAAAAILGDGSVVTWGNSARGGDSSAVQDPLWYFTVTLGPYLFWAYWVSY